MLISALCSQKKLKSVTVTSSPVPLISAFTVVQKPRPWPIYIVSDLHAGDGGPRDNFAHGNRESLFNEFLDFVEARNGWLIIAGDLLDCWEFNISKVITYRLPLLNRLARMRATYILGNHDSDLNYFIGTKLLQHPLISGACRELEFEVADCCFRIIHGHEADPYCVSDTPGVGRITAILTGLAEDRNGGPMASKYKTIAQKVVGPMDRAVSHFNWLLGKPSREKQLNRALRTIRDSSCDILIGGHTHKAGRIGDWYYNSGTWAEFVNSFVRIDPDGTVGVFDWNGRAVPKNTELPI